MIQNIKSPITVAMLYDHKTRVATPKALIWDGHKYFVEKVGYHHKFREGLVLYHVFHVDARELSFKIKLDTVSLFWILEQISDGLPD